VLSNEIPLLLVEVSLLTREPAVEVSSEVINSSPELRVLGLLLVSVLLHLFAMSLLGSLELVSCFLELVFVASLLPLLLLIRLSQFFSIMILLSLHL